MLGSKKAEAEVSMRVSEPSAMDIRWDSAVVPAGKANRQIAA